MYLSQRFNTPQSQPVTGTTQTRNNAGGYAWQVDKWAQLNRFLILGSQGGTYYVSEQKLTLDNADVVLSCIREDGPRTVSTIVDISDKGRAPKNDPALFALAMCMSYGDLATRRAASAAFDKVVRIGTHKLHFTSYINNMRGFGRLLRRTLANSYNNTPADKLAYDVVKYQSRDGWSQRDLLRLSHPTPPDPAHAAIYQWVTQGTLTDDHTPDIIMAFEAAKRAGDAEFVISLIQDYNLPRECIPTTFLNDPNVWAALLEKMPPTAMIRNLGKMTEVGLLKPLSTATVHVIEQITNPANLRRARLHPFSILVALKTYAQGHGVRGSLTWDPVPQIINALDSAFYLSFDNITPTNKRTMLALDVSGSMSFHELAGMPGITPRVAAAAMALVTAASEPNHIFTGFSHDLIPLNISPRQRLDDVIRYTEGIPFGATDCALPMLYALKNNLEIDTFNIYTDSETWYGRVHPFQALRQYRNATGIQARLAVVAMTANDVTIADPDDPLMLDVCGFDTSTPEILSMFSRGEI
jgi:60 kDa SS-A/Ro ribonucleoprotein